MRRWFASVYFAAALTAAAQQPAEPAGTNKHVVIDKTTQTLCAYEGERLVLEIRVSTGKWDKSTPNGQYAVGVKERMHYSKLFQNAPMPYSVQITGNVFVHGFSYVPRFPASHGCIRVPLDEGNPAKRFFEWVEAGTPVEITGHWEGHK